MRSSVNAEYKWLVFYCPLSLKTAFSEACDSKSVKPQLILQRYIQRYSLKGEYDCLVLFKVQPEAGESVRSRVELLSEVRAVFRRKCRNDDLAVNARVCAFMRHFIARHRRAIQEMY